MSTEVVEASLVALGQVSTATIGHIRNEGFADPEIRPLREGSRASGRCTTLRQRRGDPTLRLHAIAALRPGDVLVIDQGADRRHAGWGELVMLAAKNAGVAGVVVDGAVTDVRELRALGIPVFARGASARILEMVPANKVNVDDFVNVPIDCGGVAVSPGDLVVADDDGVVFLTPLVLESVLQLALSREQRLPWQRRWLARGHMLQEIAGMNLDELRAKVLADTER